MPRFQSSIGGDRPISGQPMRELEVPDESQRQVPPTQSRRQQQISQAEGMDLGAIRNFQNRLSGSPVAQQDLPPPQTMRFGSIGNQTVGSMKDLSQSESEIQRLRDLQRGKSRLSEAARRRIEMLLEMVRDTKTVELPSGTYTLQTLQSQELREALVAIAPYDATVQGPFESRRQLLARSLIQIAGVSIHQFVGSTDLEARLEALDYLPEALLNRLFAEYKKLLEESRDKYGIKNEADAKEVLGDLKK